MTDTGDQSDPDDGDSDGPSNGPDGTEVDDADSASEDELTGASVGTDLDDVVLDELDADGDGESGEASRGLFDDLLSGEPIFENKEVLRPSYTPHKLPHREEQINKMATILVTALRGDSPSNILIYGKTGTGKTASAKFVSEELETTSQKYEVPCEVEYINCEVTDTQYRVLAQLANKFIEKNEAVIDDRVAELESLRERAREDDAELADSEFDGVEAVTEEIDDLESDREGFEEVPMTGWPTDRVYSSFFDAVDYHERVVVIMLDEIDKLVEKSGDDTLYNLSRMNSQLENSRVSIMGISNDLKFTDFLDPRVKSSLGEEEIVFPPYDANQLRDILDHRSDVSFKDDALSDDVIPLCAAFAAQEHGDARRALDLLRTAGELAERDQTDLVQEAHVRKAQEKIELDRVVEVVRTLPTQSKIVLFAIMLLEKNGVRNINTGEVYNIYKRLCEEIDADILTQRRVTDLISELDMLGIVNAVVVSKGRYGRTKEISLSVPLEETEAVLLSDSRLGDIDDAEPFVQARFDN
ncbi:ORC complex protein Cdc6/Orc1 [Halomicrobium zhouii]|uniref:ORC1-type DNA replication protein n=1 Tax=Halomicrobium zhouii TaxID=767519 RepID=A0A1I6K419_9EURY|nr:ORC1-type DNA replication protein [Halomicrobium zhouii]SFR86015.1 ORC complex protein Cdc6/Orc1 [Halomicrobium zhouii]